MGKKREQAGDEQNGKFRDRIKEMRKVRAADLVANPLNWRTHGKEQSAAMRGILEEVGWVDALLVREIDDDPGRYEIIDGHLRATQDPDGEVPVLVLDVTADEARKILLTFDPISAMAGVDPTCLDQLLRQVEFSDSDLQSLVSKMADDAGLLGGLHGDKPIVEDEVPEPPVDPITKTGDLWILGEHRLLCGDSTLRDNVQTIMDGQLASAVLTDPPYGVGYVGKTDDALPVHNDEPESLLPLLQSSLTLACEVCHPGAIWYVAAPAGPQFFEFATVLRHLEIWRQTLVWVKQTLVMGRSDYHYQHEAIFYGWKPGAAHQPPPDRRQTTLWHFDRPTASREHPTMKPVGLYAKMLENSTRSAAIVYEPFGGSGTTLIAAEQTGRRCRCLEISPQYCDVIVKRWETLTGKKAVLERTNDERHRTAVAQGGTEAVGDTGSNLQSGSGDAGEHPAERNKRGKDRGGKGNRKHSPAKH